MKNADKHTKQLSFEIKELAEKMNRLEERVLDMEKGKEKNKATLNFHFGPGPF